MNKSTTQLENNILSTKNMETWAEKNESNMAEMSLAEYLQQLLQQYNAKKCDIISRAMTDPTYTYELFKGAKKKPDREILLQLAFGFPLTVQETKHLLYYGNASTLYPRVKRDAYIMFALQQGYSLEQANQFLFENHLQTLTDVS